MASSWRSRIASITRSSTPDDAPEPEADKFRLIVTAGPSYDQRQHELVLVNTDEATFVENEFLVAKIKVRIKNFRGLPSSCPSTSAYFDNPVHDHDLYSIGFSFVPKQDLPGAGAVWGNDFDHSIRHRIPPGFNTAFRIAKEFIDPGLDCDAYADKPWLYGHCLSSWFAFRVGEKAEAEQDWLDSSDHGVLKEGADGSGKGERERCALPENSEKRRKFFINTRNQESFVFEKGRCYEGDFYNPYLDFGNFSVKLPGFNLNVIKYVGGKTHCLRYVFKNRTTGELYFNVNFTLLWGSQLQEALKIDAETKAMTDSGKHVDSNIESVLVEEGSAKIRTHEKKQNDGSHHSDDVD